MLKNFFNNY